MNLFEKIIYFLDGQMEAPTNYGWFHILFLCLVIIGTILLCKFFKNCDDTTFKQILLISWIIMLSLELYKAIVFSFDYENGIVTWDYPWYSFPFQFCSTTHYVLPFIIFLNNDKLRDIFISFMSTFVLFAGLAVMIYPNDVFCSTIGVNIQTMIHHGLQVILGVFCIVYNRKKYNILYCLKSLIVFVSVLFVAMFLNIIIYNIFKANNIDDSFNMFYISPYFECTLPILSVIYNKTPYIVFLLTYILGFSFINFLFYFISKLIINKVCKVTIDE